MQVLGRWIDGGVEGGLERRETRSLQEAGAVILRHQHFSFQKPIAVGKFLEAHLLPFSMMTLFSKQIILLFPISESLSVVKGFSQVFSGVGCARRARHLLPLFCV